MKIKHPLTSCVGNGTFEFGYGTAKSTSKIEKRESTSALQQMI
jgi:hypothetical protein